MSTSIACQKLCDIIEYRCRNKRNGAPHIQEYFTNNTLMNLSHHLKRLMDNWFIVEKL
jgi:hypothetical protein